MPMEVTVPFADESEQVKFHVPRVTVIHFKVVLAHGAGREALSPTWMSAIYGKSVGSVLLTTIKRNTPGGRENREFRCLRVMAIASAIWKSGKSASSESENSNKPACEGPDTHIVGMLMLTILRIDRPRELSPLMKMRS